MHPHSARRPSWAFGDTGWYGIARLTMECVRPERPRPVAASSRAQVRDHSISPRALEVAGVVTRDPGSGRPLWVIAIQIANPAAESGWHRNGLIPPAVHQDRRRSRRSSRSPEPSTRASPLWIQQVCRMSRAISVTVVAKQRLCGHADMPTCRLADLQKCKYADMAQNPLFLIERSTTRNAKPEHRLRISSKSSRPAAPVSDFPSESSAD